MVVRCACEVSCIGKEEGLMMWVWGFGRVECLEGTGNDEGGSGQWGKTAAAYPCAGKDEVCG